MSEQENYKDFISPIEEAIQDIQNGQMIILVDDEDRENEGDFVFAAEKCTPHLINVMMSYGKGLICMPMTEEYTQKLNLPQQVYNNETIHNTAFTVSIDAAKGIGTGISANDRSHTVLISTADNAKPADLVRPGHIFPLQSRPGGTLVRPGHTEASTDLARLAGLKSQAVICEILNDQGVASKLPELCTLAKALGMKIYTIRDLIHYRIQNEPVIEKIESVQLPTEYGDFELHAYQSFKRDQRETYLALTLGADQFNTKTPLVRVHAEWSIKNLINRMKHEEGSMVNIAMKKIADYGCGTVLFIRHQPEPYTQSPFSGTPYPTDIWKNEEYNDFSTIGAMDQNTGFGIGAQILKDLGITKMNILSNSSMTFKGVGNFDIEILDRIPFGRKQ